MHCVTFLFAIFALATPVQLVAATEAEDGQGYLDITTGIMNDRRDLSASSFATTTLITMRSDKNIDTVYFTRAMKRNATVGVVYHFKFQVKCVGNAVSCLMCRMTIIELPDDKGHDYVDSNCEPPTGMTNVKQDQYDPIKRKMYVPGVAESFAVVDEPQVKDLADYVIQKINEKRSDKVELVRIVTVLKRFVEGTLYMMKLETKATKEPGLRMDCLATVLHHPATNNRGMIGKPKCDPNAAFSASSA